MLDDLRLLLDCQELLGKVLHSVTEEATLRDGSIKKANFVSVKVSWTTMVDITWLRARVMI